MQFFSTEKGSWRSQGKRGISIPSGRPRESRPAPWTRFQAIRSMGQGPRLLGTGPASTCTRDQGFDPSCRGTCRRHGPPYPFNSDCAIISARHSPYVTGSYCADSLIQAVENISVIYGFRTCKFSLKIRCSSDDQLIGSLLNVTVQNDWKYNFYTHASW